VRPNNSFHQANPPSASLPVKLGVDLTFIVKLAGAFYFMVVFL
jgi:hypothetical protein